MLLLYLVQVLTEEDASANLREQFGDAWFQELCESTAGRGEVTAMCLARIGAVSSWMLLAGPPDPAKVRCESAYYRPPITSCNQS